MWAAIIHSPLLWGFLGALFYGAWSTAFCFWGEVTPTSNARKLTLATAAIGLFFGPIAALAFAEQLVSWAGRFDVRSASLAIGIFATYVAPIAVRGVGKRVGKVIGGE